MLDFLQLTAFKHLTRMSPAFSIVDKTLFSDTNGNTKSRHTNHTRYKFGWVAGFLKPTKNLGLTMLLHAPVNLTSSPPRFYKQDSIIHKTYLETPRDLTGSASFVLMGQFILSHCCKVVLSVLNPTPVIKHDEATKVLESYL